MLAKTLGLTRLLDCLTVRCSMTATIRTFLALVFCAPASTFLLQADTITFFDATDYGGALEVVTTAPGRVDHIVEGSLGPTVFWVGPSPNATVTMTSGGPPLGFSHVNIGEYPQTGNPFLDFESDIFSGFVLPDKKMVSLSMIIQTTFPCAGEGGCFFLENGALQTIATVTWSDGTIDTIKFQSLPEPSAFVLFVPVRSRRRRTRLHPNTTHFLPTRPCRANHSLA